MGSGASLSLGQSKRKIGQKLESARVTSAASLAPSSATPASPKAPPPRMIYKNAPQDRLSALLEGDEDDADELEVLVR